MMGDRPELSPPTWGQIEEAAENIKGKAIRTPLVKLNVGDLCASSPDIYLKLENLQPIGKNIVYFSYLY